MNKLLLIIFLLLPISIFAGKPSAGLGDEHDDKTIKTTPSRESFNNIKKKKKIKTSDFQNKKNINDETRDVQNINSTTTDVMPPGLGDKHNDTTVKTTPNKDNYDKVTDKNKIETSNFRNNKDVNDETRDVQNIDNKNLLPSDLNKVKSYNISGLSLANVNISGRVGLRTKLKTEKDEINKLEFENITEFSFNQKFNNVAYNITLGTLNENYYSNRWISMGSFDSYSLSLGVVEANLTYENKKFNLALGRFKNDFKSRYFYASYLLFNGLKLNFKNIGKALSLKNVTSILKDGEPIILNTLELLLNFDSLDFGIYYVLLYGDDVNTTLKDAKNIGFNDIYSVYNHYVTTYLNYKIKLLTGEISIFVNGSVNLSVENSNLGGDIGLKYKNKDYTLRGYFTYKERNSVIAPFAPTGAIISDILGGGLSFKYNLGKTSLKVSTFIGDPISDLSEIRSESKIIWEMKF
jgi:hypothetical protein